LKKKKQKNFCALGVPARSNIPCKNEQKIFAELFFKKATTFFKVLPSWVLTRRPSHVMPAKAGMTMMGRWATAKPSKLP